MENENDHLRDDQLEIFEILGRGGTGVVYRGEDWLVGCRSVLEVLGRNGCGIVYRSGDWLAGWLVGWLVGIGGAGPQWLRRGSGAQYHNSRLSYSVIAAVVLMAVRAL